MTNTALETPFPVDWDAWRGEWHAWKHEHESSLKRVASPFRGKNFLADEILGVWKINGVITELSEVTFPNLTKRDPATGRLLEGRVRAIGWTQETANGVVHSFTELERVLGL